MLKKILTLASHIPDLAVVDAADIIALTKPSLLVIFAKKFMLTESYLVDIIIFMTL